MIEEAYVSFEVAKLLKRVSFSGKCRTCYYKDGTFIHLGGVVVSWPDVMLSGEPGYLAPTQQMACEWLRQEYNLSVEVYRTACGYIGCVVAIPSGTDIKFLEDDGDDLPSGQYTAHAKACEAAIKYCLENLIKEE